MLNPVLPNREDDEAIQSYLIQRGTESFRQLAGFQPQKIEDLEKQSFSFPIEREVNFSAIVSTRRRHISFEVVKYLSSSCKCFILLWIWLGKDNPNSICRDESLNYYDFQSIVEIFKTLSGEKFKRGFRLRGLSPFSLREMARTRTQAKSKGRYKQQDVEDELTAIYDSITQSIHQQASKLKWLSDEELLQELRPMMLTFYDKFCDYHAKGL